MLQFLLCLLDIGKVSIIRLWRSSRESVVVENHFLCQMLSSTSRAEQFGLSSTTRCFACLSLPPPKSLKQYNKDVSGSYLYTASMLCPIQPAKHSKNAEMERDGLPRYDDSSGAESSRRLQWFLRQVEGIVFIEEWVRMGLSSSIEEASADS